MDHIINITWAAELKSLIEKQVLLHFCKFVPFNVVKTEQ